MTDVVIASAVRTPVGSFNGALSSLLAHELGKAAIVEALNRAKVRAGGGERDYHGPDLGRRRRPEPGAPSRGRGDHSIRSDRLRRQPALWLGPPQHRARLTGDEAR